MEGVMSAARCRRQAGGGRGFLWLEAAPASARRWQWRPPRPAPLSPSLLARKLNSAWHLEAWDRLQLAALDTTDHASVESFFATEEAWDHVIVSAAETTSGPVRKLSLSEARATIGSKFWGAYHVARSAKIREHGSLCLISGFRSVRPSANTVLQGAVNAALEALVRGLALEFAPIRVNAVSPGLIATPLWAGMAEAEREAMFASAAAR